jgi:hypothetical protein
VVFGKDEIGFFSEPGMRFALLIIKLNNYSKAKGFEIGKGAFLPRFGRGKERLSIFVRYSFNRFQHNPGQIPDIKG